jgi:hypothetical protein
MGRKLILFFAFQPDERWTEESIHPGGQEKTLCVRGKYQKRRGPPERLSYGYEKGG